MDELARQSAAGGFKSLRFPSRLRAACPHPCALVARSPACFHQHHHRILFPFPENCLVIWLVRLGSQRLSTSRYATNLLKADVGLDKVKTLLGHSSIQITVDTYGHFLPGKERQSTLTDAMAAARQGKQTA